MRGFAAMAALCALGLAAPARAEPADIAAPQPTLAQMVARDRFNTPEVERGAWAAFVARMEAGGQLSPTDMARARTGYVVALFYANDFEEAARQAQQAEALLADARPPFLYELLAYASLTATDRKRFDEARALADRAMAAAIERYGADSAEAGLVHNAIAYVAYKSGDLVGGRREMCEAARLAQAHLPPSDPMVVNNLTSCGVTLYFTDDPSAADVLESAANIAMRNLPPDHLVTALALSGSGAVLFKYGRYPEAERIFRRLIEIERSHRSPHAPEVYPSMSMLGRILAREGRFDEALAVNKGAMDYAAQMDPGGDPTSRAMSIINYAKSLVADGRRGEALPLLREAVGVAHATLEPDDTVVALAELTLAQELARSGELAQALGLAGPALKRLGDEVAANSRMLLEWKLNYAEMLALAGRRGEALERARVAGAELEAQLFDFAQTRPQIVSLNEMLTLGFDTYLDIAMMSGASDDVLRAAQLSLLSELSLANADLVARAGAREAGLGALITRYRNARAEVTKARDRQAAAEAQGDDLAGATGALERAQAELAGIEAAIRRDYPRFFELSRPAVADAPALQAMLGERQALVLPVKLHDRIATVAVTREGVFWAEASDPGHQSAELRERMLASIAAARLAPPDAMPPFDVAAAHDLFARVFPSDLWVRLKDKDELLFPASGPLAAIDPAMLVSHVDAAGRPRWLIEDKAVAVYTGGEGPAAGAGGPWRTRASRVWGHRGLPLPPRSSMSVRCSAAARRCRANLPSCPACRRRGSNWRR